ncbi:hypothetical protein K491DRAFT_596130 [Lophiostoma macrostomum CBS 122681]|uniref:gamma-glutamylcyclotransferase n=1 Tax=Lophiostoma macrostomum CBS 122681 TaxID=1314788 RepID=A0A6A6TAE9_9PLEO|nr:hypothetical protein K491DRAFT_596130 [Lophiostoma macrostomum CBS 122681]
MDMDELRWYFAYGSNMCDTVFCQRRGIRPRQLKLARIESHCLDFNVPFLPYSEPGMAGLRRLGSEASEFPVHGVAYLLSDEDFTRMIRSEGAGVAYRVISLVAHSLTDDKSFIVSTLIARRKYPLLKSRYPSSRYMGLIIQGAKEQKIPIAYQEYLARIPVFLPSESLRWRIGRWVFHQFWRPISTVVQKGTRELSNHRGQVPGWYLTLFDFLLVSMWVQHDFCFSIIFGRGDGRLF